TRKSGIKRPDTWKKMRTQSVDTSPEMEKLHIKLLRQAGLTRRFGMVRNLSRSTRKMAWQSLVRSRPHLNLSQKRLFFIELLYGKELAQAVKNNASKAGSGAIRDEEKLNMDADVLATIAGVVE